jgi:pyruvate dehydrogenase E2 component (dihydrolipoamide acetyltransferase)
VVQWLKNVGDFCEAGQVIMVVESDKADMDVEAFEDGYLAAILVDAGQTADVGLPWPSCCKRTRYRGSSGGSHS